ncbi:MAG: hypothetical protein PHG25_03200 [Candidatus Pacebacteria bacterium]|nr:hypothetical protein [Candidatus Paceibacterota bacterium]
MKKLLSNGWVVAITAITLVVAGITLYRGANIKWHSPNFTVFKPHGVDTAQEIRAGRMPVVEKTVTLTTGGVVIDRRKPGGGLYRLHTDIISGFDETYEVSDLDGYIPPTAIGPTIPHVQINVAAERYVYRALTLRHPIVMKYSLWES